jgi:hypothetical protein
MTEDFLHYLWRHQYLNTAQFKTKKNQALEILQPGLLNSNAGPDFTEAKIKLDNQTWAGQIEIHINSSDWRKHKHDEDKAYDGVVLHVVYEQDEPVLYTTGQEIPTLEIKGLFDEHLYWRYEQLMQTQLAIPCQNVVKSVDDFLKSSMLERTLVGRLEQKQKEVFGLLKRNIGDWRLTYYHWLSQGFGLKVNVQPMLMLAQLIDPNLVGRLDKNSLQATALFLGMAGFLTQPADAYSQELAKEFRYLQNKHSLQPLENTVWKNARLRPPAFPEFRIALLAAFWSQDENTTDFLQHFKSRDTWHKLLKVQAGEYWTKHYRLGKPSAKLHTAGLGVTAQNLLLINVVVPFIYAYGKAQGNAQVRDNALELLLNIAPEKNKITRIFEPLNFKNSSAYDSQALLQLYQKYCTPKACLTCTIGSKILRS